MSAENKRLMRGVVLSNHPIGLAVIRGLGAMGVPITAISYNRHNDAGYTSKYVSEKIFSPHPERDEDAFIKLLIDYAKQNGRMFLIPSDDATLVAVSRNKNKLDEYYITQCTDWETTQQYLDKKYTYALAEKNGIPAPKTFIADSIAKVEEYARTIGFPCLVKPCYSHRYFERFRKKVARVKSRDELIKEFYQATAYGMEVMIQELITGEDTQGVNYNSMYINGEPFIEFTAEKIRISESGFGFPCVVKSRDNIPEVQDSGRRILKALNYTGYSCTEFKMDQQDGRYKLLEVNGRHNRSTLLSICCGVNFPWILYNYYVYGNLPHHIDYRKGVYWIDEFKDLSTISTRVFKERYPVNLFIGPYLHRHIFAVFDLRDIYPFITRWLQVLRIISRSILHLSNK